MWLSVIAGIALLLGLRALWRRRYRAGLLWMLCAIALSVLAYSQHQISLNLQGYFPIYYERDIAAIRVEKTDGVREILVRDRVAGNSYRWQPKGEQWQLELRVIALEGPCALITDWPDHYRLSRLQVHTPAEGDNNPVIHDVQLQQVQKGWDLWGGLRSFMAKRPDLVDEIESCIRVTRMTSGRFPLSDNGHFRASIRQSGLHIRSVKD